MRRNGRRPDFLRILQPRTTMPALVIFDLDGTLCDTLEDITGAVNGALVRLGRPPLTPEQVRGRVGHGARVLMQQCLGGSDVDLETAYRSFLELYRGRCLVKTAPYPGVPEGLARLRNVPKVVFSNKPVEMTRRIIDGLNLARHFIGVYGAGSFERKKPDPQPIRAILKQHGSSHGIMVGDSGVDLQAARAAGLPFIGVEYGFGRPEELEGADARARDFGEVVRLLGLSLGAPGG